jgi:hypothetical protein
MMTGRSLDDSRPIAPLAAADLDRLIDTLMVKFVWLAECPVGEGYRFPREEPTVSLGNVPMTRGM